jgi:subtilisin family serine protease
MARRGWVAALVVAVMFGLFPAGAPGPVAAAEPNEHLKTPIVPAGDGQPLDPIPQIPPTPGAGAWPGAPICKHASGRVLVRFKDPQRGRAAAYRAIGGRQIRGFATVPGLEVVSTKLQVLEAARRLRDDPAVEFVEPDCKINHEAIPNDPEFDQLWGLDNFGQQYGTPGADIGAAEAWDIRTNASAVTVAVIDTGIYISHPDLYANAWFNTDEIHENGIDDDGNGYIDDRLGWDFVNHDWKVGDDNGHGTHVAGTIGARGNNGIGISGVAWQVKLMSLKVLDSSGSGYISDAVAAIDYAADNGARIINASFGSTEFSRALYDAFHAAGEMGILTVAAAGNSGVNTDEKPHYPASFRLDTMISVAATTRFDELAGFSNHGIYTVDVAAPGESIYSTIYGSYAVMSGTSMATPHVTGAAALLLAQNPSWSPAQLRQRLVGTTRAVPALAGKAWSGGVIDIGKALSGAATVLPPMPPASTPVALTPATVADPAPAPVAAPTPPELPTAEVVESSATDLSEPKIAFDADGTPHIAYIRRFEGVRLASRTGSTWSDRQVTSAYDDLFYLDLAIGTDDVPQIAVQRAWSSLTRYTDPGIIMARAPAAGPTLQRITAACPQASSCYWDWHPSTAIDGANARHVAFIRTAAWDQDMVKADSGSAVVPGDGLYYATDATGSWVVRRVLPDVNGGPPAVAVEGNGTAHIVAGIQDGSASGLYYVTNDGGTWTSLRLTTNVSDSSADVAVDAAGGVHVVYSRLGLGVWYRYRSPAGTWSAAQRAFDGVTYRAAIALDGGGKAHVAIGVMDGFNTIDGVMYATNKSGAWATKSVEGAQAGFPSIAVDPTGKVGIAYRRHTGAPVGIVVALESAGTFAKSFVRTFSDGAGAGNLAHAIDGNGHSHVILGRGMGSSSPGVWYATNASGAWLLQKVAHGFPNAAAIAVDATGRPHIAFTQQPQEQAGAPVTTRVGYAVRTAGSWSVKTVSTASYGDGVAIALDAAGTPSILWPDGPGTRLRHARPAGTGWTTENAYSGPGTQIREMSALIDPSGVLHVAFDASFAGVPGSRLMYAKRSGDTWANGTVAGGGAYHFYPSIARTPSGTLWIVDMRSGPAHADGVWAYSRTGGGGWAATNLGPDLADSHPSVAVDAAGRVRVVWSRGWFYSSSGCTVPMCAIGPGLRESVWDGGTWSTTKLSAMWHDIYARIASGPGGAVRIVWQRLQVGLRATTRVAGTDILAPGATLTPAKTITNAASVSYAVRFTEPVTGLTASDFSRTGTATGCVIGTPTGSGTSWTVVITGCGTGTLALRLGASTVVDAGSKAGPPAAVTAATVMVDHTKPTVTAPTLTPRTKTPLSGTNIPVRIAWTGADIGAGIASYTLQRSMDGGATWTTLADKITGTTFDALIAASGTRRFRVSAIDKAGNVSTIATAATRSGRLLQQSSSLVRYSGTWTLASSSAYSGGSARYTKTAGRSASLTFSARSIALVTTRATTRGKVRIYINGVDQGIVDLYRSPTQHRSLVWQKTWTTTTSRIIRVEAVGTIRVDVDAFVLIQ